jgi:hypothetical protein
LLRPSTKRKKGVVNNTNELLVHGEDLTVPVHRGSDSSQLGSNSVSKLVLPLPNLLNEVITGKVVLCLLFIVPNFLLDDCLGSDTGVIGTRDPKDTTSAHTVVAAESVLNGVGESMTKVKRAGNVGRRNNDDKLLLSVTKVGPR